MTGSGGVPEPYVGQISEAFLGTGLPERLSDVAMWVREPASVMSSGRNNVVLVQGVEVREGESVDLVVKSFGQPALWRNVCDKWRATRARRSWSAAERLASHGVGTPRPVAWLDSWTGNRLTESYYVSIREPDVTDLRREIIRLFREDPACWKIMNLLERIALSVRAMHRAGVIHRDLGNQNILLTPEVDGHWEAASFVDLNRARIFDELSEIQIARDFSRLHLPSDLLRVLYEMYFDARPSAEFSACERRCRRRYGIHARTRKIRHPFREARIARNVEPRMRYPEFKDVWIWDHRSAQPINVLHRRDRNKLHSPRDALGVFVSTLCGAPALLRSYRKNLRQAFARQILMKERIGLAIEPSDETLDAEMGALQSLGAIPILIRFYAHAGPEGWEQAMTLARRVHERGHPVTAAFVQSRDAIRDPSTWDSMLQLVLDRLHPFLDWVEIGHAVNRVKWGAWSHRERMRILSPLPRLREKYPGIRFMGPAAIDFEIPYPVSTLRGLPEGSWLDAMSHHLYVDRRGAPENRQGPFDTLRKCAMTLAAGASSSRCSGGLIVSEVNWPLTGTGVYSPVVSPYDTPGPRKNDPGVDEETYADYMIRYLLITICSGLVERVYWWRLVARGYGLIDDTEIHSLRPRPAFHMLQRFLTEVGDATFERYESAPPDVHLYFFLLEDGRSCVVAYRTGSPAPWALPFECDQVRAATGETADLAGGKIELSGRPVYLIPSGHHGIRKR